jgi:pyridoxine 5-phosphate synthase
MSSASGKTPDSRVILLGVNVDHVATVRQARGGIEPDPCAAALLAEQSGADSITVHRREDQRHIQDHDLVQLKSRMTTRMNLEIAATDAMVILALDLRPADCCLVPERRQELTTEGGLDVVAQLPRIREVCGRLAAGGIRVSLFIDADPAQVAAAAAAGAAAVELHTGVYADAGSADGRRAELDRLVAASRQAAAAGLQVNAGHGLNYHNVGPVAAIPEVVELNIGHAIVSRALFVGLGKAVSDMKQLMREARGG